MNTPLTNTFFSIRALGALFALGLATGCQPELAAPEEIPLRMERTGDTLRFSWEGDQLHRFEVIQCDEAPSEEYCTCSGHLVWGLGASSAEKFHEVALAEPFLPSPVQYGATPESDRKGYAARPLEAGKTYLVSASRVGPCELGTRDCQETVAQGCQRFTW